MRIKSRYQTEPYLKEESGYTRMNILKLRIGDYHDLSGSRCTLCNTFTPATSLHIFQCQHFQATQVQFNIPIVTSEIEDSLHDLPPNVIQFINKVTKDLYLSGQTGFAHTRTRVKTKPKINPYIT